MATIMIVEDDRQTNDAVSEYLKSFGHRMLSAYDGDEALQLFECSSIAVGRIVRILVAAGSQSKNHAHGKEQRQHFLHFQHGESSIYCFIQ